MTMRDLEKLFKVAPNLAAKTIRLYPHNSLSFFTEGLGEIYDVKEKQDNFKGLNDKAYKWKLRGHSFPKIRLATRVTGGAISGAAVYGANGLPFVIAFEKAYYNPNDIIKFENGSKVFVLSEPDFKSENLFEYTVRANSSDETAGIAGSTLVAGKYSGSAGVAFPELSEKGYIKAQMNAEEHVNYITKVRYDWTWSADAAATKYLIEDVVNHNGKEVRNTMITDQLWLQALEGYHFNKEMELIYGETTMDERGRCFMQDKKGQDIVKGDGFLNQIAPHRKQNYTTLTIDLLEDILMDMAMKMPKKTGNTLLLSTGMVGYRDFGRIMRAEHKGWNVVPDPYIQSKGGKIKLGAEYNAYTFQGNTIVVSVNNVFDHPANVSPEDNEGYNLESSKMLFIDTSKYDGVPNLQMVAKDGRSFITGELDGIGGQDGKTSGKVATLLDGSAKAIIGTMGLVVHNPYSSVILEKKII
jgi:hypothetical protein